MEHIFIVGVARTGSKIYRNVINGCTDIDTLNELHYLSPRWIRQDFRRTVSKAVGSPLSVTSLDLLLDVMYQKTLEGTFWRMGAEEVNGNESCIFDIRRDDLAERLRRTDLSFPAILDTLMCMHAEMKNKRRGGAKFPVNIACCQELCQWFPDAHYIHIVRDPRAIYASMTHMDLRGHEIIRRSQRVLSASKRFAFLVHQYRWAARIHARLAGGKKYRLFRFEDTIQNPERQIDELCEFLSVPFKEAMLTPKMEDSSFLTHQAVHGFDRDAADRWRNKVSPQASRAICALLRREMALFGYHNS